MLLQKILNLSDYKVLSCRMCLGLCKAPFTLAEIVLATWSQRAIAKTLLKWVCLIRLTTYLRSIDPRHIATCCLHLLDHWQLHGKALINGRYVLTSCGDAVTTRWQGGDVVVTRWQHVFNHTTWLQGLLVYIIREEAQSFATHDLRCRACLPNCELAVSWTSVSRWFLT